MLNHLKDLFGKDEKLPKDLKDRNSEKLDISTFKLLNFHSNGYMICGLAMLRSVSDQS
jgi:hypothetical protein